MADLETPAVPMPDPDESAPKREKSAGERLFDRTVYTGIGFGLNEASSLWITDQFMHGKNLLAKVPGLKTAGAWFSAEGFNRASEGLARLFRLTEKTARDGSRILPKDRAGNGLLMVTLISGGTLLILPMKWLEDKRIYWVQKANHLLDRLRGSNMTPEETAARDRQVEQAIACSPRQSWPSMLKGRLIAVGSSISAGTFVMGPERNKKLMDWSEKAVTGSVQPEGRKTAAHRYARLLSVETYSCAISSIVLELTSKLFAARKYTAHDPQICREATAQGTASPAGGGEDKKDDCRTCAFTSKIQPRKDRPAEPAALQM